MSLTGLWRGDRRITLQVRPIAHSRTSDELITSPSKYPKFPDRIHEALCDIFGEKGKGIKTYNAEDGSGVGSAIIAAMTVRFLVALMLVYD